MKLLMWFVKIVLTVLLVSSLTLLTTGLIVQSYAKSLLASFNIQWEGQPMGLTAMFQGALGGKTSEGNKPGNGTTDQPTGADEEQVPEDAVSVMGNGAEGSESGVDTGNDASQGAARMEVRKRAQEQIQLEDQTLAAQAMGRIQAHRTVQ
ncbi:hypothetical protein P9222_05535 [Paenibacillus amylolyticus]|nr:hypothetical protein [Paenibacillus amylolyticus]WFR63732.1 hypothetical protein P9222_05535 [Paenibacillus amylolyticus]